MHLICYQGNDTRFVEYDRLFERFISAQKTLVEGGQFIRFAVSDASSSFANDGAVVFQMLENHTDGTGAIDTFRHCARCEAHPEIVLE